MDGLKVLLTNYELRRRAGSQLYLCDAALGLLRRGHRPFVYSPLLGAVAQELRHASVPVVDDLASIAEPPDVIHGQHTHELMVALLRFPAVPAIRLCHGSLDQPPFPFPRVRRYVAVDHTTRDRCLFEWGLPPDRVEVLLNFADLRRFAARAPLPERPERALVFSNRARAHLWAVRQACEAAGIAVAAIGEGVQLPESHPERVLGDYDLVFAKGRAAIEAMATGAAVVLCDADGSGPLVTTAGYERLRALNFGIRALRDPVRPDALAHQIARYDARDAEAVSQRIRSEADADVAIDRLVEVYREVIDEHRALRAGEPEADLRAASAYLATLTPQLRGMRGAWAGLYLMLKAFYRWSLGVPVVRQIVRSRSFARLRGRVLSRLSNRRGY